ncbi:MAG: hypothetical protein QNJ26_03890 [Desulfobacterales bacterium]|nr:hypothetical protein [Desulfobacterales bacterium]
MPLISFFTSHSQDPVTHNSLIWQQPIPLRLDALFAADDVSVSHANYFQAAQAFLQARSYDVITRAASQQLGHKVKPQDIAEIRVRLEKHGAYYHPARIETYVGQQQHTFVLNVAISEPGRRFIEQDYQNLMRLNAETPLHYLPQVYGWDRMTLSGGLKCAMFLGEWFDGYHEFHLAPDPADKAFKIIVWDEIGGRYYLTAEQTQKLYAQAAKILTCYYNLTSFEQILAWHHAAGDFVLNIDSDRLRLRLVTVRGYGAGFQSQQRAKTEANDPQRLLQALLVFFLHLSLQMRLDRLEGVGDMVWSDSATVDATLTGFLDALSLKPDTGVLPDSPLTCFVAYLSTCQASDLLDLAETMVNRFNPRMPELPVIKQNLNEHVLTLHKSIQQFLSLLK